MEKNPNRELPFAHNVVNVAQRSDSLINIAKQCDLLLLAVNIKKTGSPTMLNHTEHNVEQKCIKLLKTLNHIVSTSTPASHWTKKSISEYEKFHLAK